MAQLVWKATMHLSQVVLRPPDRLGPVLLVLCSCVSLFPTSTCRRNCNKLDVYSLGLGIQKVSMCLN